MSALRSISPLFAEFEERAAQATPADRCRGLCYNGALHVIRELAGPQAAQRALKASGERLPLDFLNYPVTGFQRLCMQGIEVLEPRLGSAEAVLQLLGKRAVDDFLASPAGKTLVLLAYSDPRRMVRNLPSGYRACVTYGDRRVVWRGPTQCTFSMICDYMPHPYHEGILATVLTTLGASNVRVRGTRVGVVDADYELSWD